MGSATAKRSIRDAVARSDRPAQNNQQAGVMTVEGGTRQRIPHIQAPAPCPPGCSVTSAKLLLRQSSADAGDRTLSLRRITEQWREGTLTWKNRPARTSTVSASATVTGAGSVGRIVEFDVTADYQDYVDGVAKNFGWTLESGNGNKISFYTSDAASRQPTLVVTWSNRPEPPTDMLPSGGGVVSTAKPILRWSFIDLGGDTTLADVQVQISSTGEDWTPSAGFGAGLVFDSGPVPSGKPQLNLAGTSYAGMTAGVPVWWTARHRDGAGLWSKWGDPQQTSYQPLTPATLNNPTGTVYDTTFPWAWSVASQSKFELLIRDEQGEEVWSSKEVVSTSAREYTQPRGVIRAVGRTYTAVLRVWDGYKRQDIAAARAFTEVTQTFTYADTSTIEGVQGLVAGYEADDSDVTLTFTRSAMPDEFTVWLNGRQHAAVTGPEAFVSGTTYQIVLHDVPPRIEHDLTVKAVVVDGGGAPRSSSNNPTVQVRTDPIGVRLVDVTTGDQVILLAEPGQEIVSATMSDVSERFEPVRSETVVQVTSALRWFEGNVAGGVLADYRGLTAAEQRARVLAMKASPLGRRVLVWGRNACPIYLSRVNVEDVDIPGEERYQVSFEFVAAMPSPEYTLR